MSEEMIKNKKVTLTFSGYELQNINIYGTSVESVEVLVNREELLEELLEELDYQQEIRIRNLEDEIKYNLLVENFEKITLKQVENFIKDIS